MSSVSTPTHRAGAEPGPPSPAGPHTPDEDELAAVYRAKLSLRVLVVAVVAFALAATSLLAVGVWLIRGTQVHTTQLVEDTHRTSEQTKVIAARTQVTADLIRSCVKLGGKCYQRGQKQTGEAVASLNQYVVLASACAAHATGAGAAVLPVPELTGIVQDCVLQELAAGHTP